MNFQEAFFAELTKLAEDGIANNMSGTWDRETANDLMRPNGARHSLSARTKIKSKRDLIVNKLVPMNENETDPCG